MRKGYVWILIIMSLMGTLYLYINIHRYIDTKIFFRYEINYFFEFRDYFNNITIENEMFRYIVKDDYIYTYGLSGYTKTKLGLGIHIIKALNMEYDKNYINGIERRKSYSSLEEIKNKYMDEDVTFITSFDSMDDEDINTFYSLYKRKKDLEEDLSTIEKSRFSYKDGKKVAQGLRELNNSLLKEYMKRNGKINNTSK